MSIPRALLGALIVVAGACPVQALEPEDLAERWRWRLFGREEGLPSGSITAIGLDRDDFLYAGTDRAVYRYNGFTWSVLESSSPLDGGAVAKIVESGGDVYVATASAVWFARSGGELTRVLRGGRLLLAAAPLGGVYAIDAERREHWQLERGVASRVDEATPLPEGALLDYVVDDRRLHWLATREGLFRRDLRARLRWQEDPDAASGMRGRDALRLFLPQSFRPTVRAPAGVPGAPSPGRSEIWCLFGESRGAPKAAVGSVLARRGEKGWKAVEIDPSRPVVESLLVDATDTWVAATSDGRLFLSSTGGEGPWMVCARLGAGSVALSGGLVDAQGHLWFRGGSTGVVRFDGLSRRWERFTRGLGLPSNNVLSLAEAADGSIWAGTERGVLHVPFLLSGKRTDRAAGQSESAASAEPAGEPEVHLRVGATELLRVSGLAIDHTGKTWVSSETFPGVFFYHEGSWNRYEPRERSDSSEPSIATSPIRRIVSDRGGDLWFLSPAPSPNSEGDARLAPGHRLWRYSSSVYTPSTFRALTVPYGPVNDLVQAQDKGYWLATNQGLVRTADLQSDFRVWTESDGLRSRQVWAIAESADGSVWILYDPSAASGVSRLRGDRVESFDQSSGLPSPNAWSVVATIAPEGAMVWLGTDRGIARFDGECWYAHPLASLDPQESHIWPLVPGREGGEGESILAGTFGQGIFRFRRDDRRRPRITALNGSRTEDGVFGFTWDGRDFKNETSPSELLYRSRIDDGPWSAFSSTRTRSAQGLAPGDHVFHVEMRDRDGNSNREKVSLPFRVPSAGVLGSNWTGPFFLGAGLALLATLVVVLLLTRWPRRGGRLAGEREALDRFPGAALVLDGEGRVREIAGRSTQDLGLDGALLRELVGRPAALLSLFGTPAASAGLARLLHGDELRLDDVPLQAGGPRRARVRGVPLGGPAPAGALVFVEETTAVAVQALEREQSRRLESLRALADRVLEALALRGESAADARLVRVAARLERFASPTCGPSESVDLVPLVERLRQSLLAGRERDSNVAIDVRAQTGLWPLDVRRDEIAEALDEILRNAVEAVAGAGRVQINARNRRIDGGAAALSPGPYVELEVRDSGPGIPSELRERLFEPFVTSKPRAMGLGLAAAYGAIKSHGGAIRVESAAGEGTTVVILLPARPH